MKKKTIIIISLVFVISLLSFTIAYLVRETDTRSIITFGSLKMQLLETTIENGEEIEVKENDTMDISNTSNVSRIVKVKNVGNHPMYVRLKLSVIGNTKTEEEIDLTNLVTIPILENWIYQDGYYYYNNILKKNEESTPLMREIIFNNQTLSNDYLGAKIKLEIDAYAVQSEHNSSNVLEAEGWPE